MKIANYGLKTTENGWEYNGSLDLRGTGITDTAGVKNSVPSLLAWQNGKYILADGIFSEVLHVKGRVYKIKKIGSVQPLFLITDGIGTFSHGSTIRQASQDLKFKLAKIADIKEFQGISSETILEFSDCIKLYRLVTGACEFGVKDFIASKQILEKRYSVKEILEKTHGHFGAETLRKFVEGN